VTPGSTYEARSLRQAKAQMAQDRYKTSLAGRPRMEQTTETPSDRTWRAAHGMLFLALIGLSWLNPGFRSWPWFWLMPLATYFTLTACIPPLRRTLVGPRMGTATVRTGIATVATIALASTALLLFQWVVHPDVQSLRDALPVQPQNGVLLAGAIFALINATCEELVFRGILFDALESEWGRRFAVGATAILFGLGHLHGYPPGWIGAGLAGIFGVMLGVLRVQTGGLSLPIIAHIAADATIYGILATGDAT
jgi:membrane protease YdiL (CAAX protease family)